MGQVRYRTGLKAHQSGATHSRHSPEQGANYVASVFRDYLDAGGLSVADLQGASVLEVGPGDNLGVAALFAAAGAKKVVCLDRFRAIATRPRTATSTGRSSPKRRSRQDSSPIASLRRRGI